jgi:predicted nucleic acid-binding protein
VKLAVEEAESNTLRDHLSGRPPLYTSEIALVEVARAASVAGEREGIEAARRVLDGCELVELDPPLLERAASLASARLRSLDAVHLASALEVRPDEFLAYDRRLLQAAEAAGLRTESPGM